MSKFSVCTHGGEFHCDDVMAAAIVAMWCAKDGHEMRLTRSRDPKDWEAADIVFDVGGRYEPPKWFDHHQVKDKYDLARPDGGVPYAAAGLVWKHFGPDLCGSTAACAEVDRVLIAPIDAADTGTPLVKDPAASFEGYSPLSFSWYIAQMNARWTEKLDAAGATVRFQTAVDACGKVLENAIGRAHDAQLIDEIVAAAGVHGRTLVLRRFCPWQEAVLRLHTAALFVIYADRDDKYMVQGVPQAAGSFELKQPLPAAWAGLRDEALAAATGVGDAVFCHPGLFICGAKTLEGALALAARATP